MAEKKKTHTRLEHIDDETLDQIITKLEEMRAESNRHVNATLHADVNPNSEENEVGDEHDQATKARQREFELLMHERHLRRLQQIEEAFQKIKDGTYGLCEGTDEPINPKRLLIMPLARYSLEYQQHQEKQIGKSAEALYEEEEPTFDTEE